MANGDVENWYEWKVGVDSTAGPRRHRGQARSSISDASPRATSPPRPAADSASVRFVNPAIYVESFRNKDPSGEAVEAVQTKSGGADSKAHKVQSLLSVLSVKGESPTGITAALPAILQLADEPSGQSTFRYYPLPSSAEFPASSVESSRLSDSSSDTPARVQRRCRIGNDEGGTGTDRKSDFETARRNQAEMARMARDSLSATSASCCSIRKERVYDAEAARRTAHQDWIRKKQRAAHSKKMAESSAERSRQEEVEKEAREAEERESRKRENFLRWTEKKQREYQARKAATEKEATLQKRLKELEDKAAIVKALNFHCWSLRKEEEQRARLRKLGLAQKQIDQERKKRSEDSEKAYEKWRETSKNKPRPATQGLLC